MLDTLKQKNQNIKFYSAKSDEFKTFGRIITDLDTSEIIKTAEKISRPTDGSAYIPSEESFEKLSIAEDIKNKYFGTLPTQIGYCHGHNNFLNGAEWHKSSEINIAVTPLVLILGHIWDIKNGEIDSSDFTAFYLPKGTAAEIYATTLHFCPCEVGNGGFGCVVGLPLDTNKPLDNAALDSLLFRKNKWLIAHNENKALIDKGVVSGISGENFKINY